MSPKTGVFSCHVTHTSRFRLNLLALELVVGIDLHTVLGGGLFEQSVERIAIQWLALDLDYTAAIAHLLACGLEWLGGDIDFYAHSNRT